MPAVCGCSSIVRDGPFAPPLKGSVVCPRVLTIDDNDDGDDSAVMRHLCVRAAASVPRLGCSNSDNSTDDDISLPGE
jgi:hypothetical protein